MSTICVSKHSKKNYFNCAKDSLYGDGAFLTGTQYSDLQDLLNEKFRTNRHLIRWSATAPPEIQAIDILSSESYTRKCQKHLCFTNMGLGRLQLELVRTYGTMRDPTD